MSGKRVGQITVKIHPHWEENGGSSEPSFDYDDPFVTHYHVTHPQNCLVVDEVGSDTSQKGDGHVGGAKYLCGRGGTPYQQSAMNDKHFTMLGFTALSGDPSSA